MVGPKAVNLLRKLDLLFRYHRLDSTCLLGTEFYNVIKILRVRTRIFNRDYVRSINEDTEFLSQMNSLWNSVTTVPED